MKEPAPTPWLSGAALDAATDPNAPAPIICECQSCDWVGPAAQLDALDETGIFDVVAAGEVMPHGRCPECGAVAHAIDTTTRKQLDRIERAVADLAEELPALIEYVETLETGVLEGERFAADVEGSKRKGYDARPLFAAADAIRARNGGTPPTHRHASHGQRFVESLRAAAEKGKTQ